MCCVSIKLADFNASRVLSPDTSYTRRPTGTSGYQAPEMFNYGGDGNVEYSYGVDVWGLGCVLYEMCMKEKFVEGITQCRGMAGTWKMVKRGEIANDAVVRDALLNGDYPHITVKNGTQSSLLVMIHTHFYSLLFYLFFSLSISIYIYIYICYV